MKNHSTTSQAHILVIEDDKPLNDAYRMILEQSGYEVDVAFDGEEALRVLSSQEQDPDVILLDLRMPVLDGIGFLKQYKPDLHPEVAIVVFSNYDTHKDIDEAYRLGVDRYVLKARTAPKDLLHLVESITSERVNR